MPNNILIIGLVWPEPKSSAAGVRMLQLIQFFKAQGYAISFASVAATSKRTFNLESLQIKTFQIELNNNSFNNFIGKSQPQIVIFDRFITEEQFGWRVAEVCPSAVRILDTEDLHGLRKARETACLAKAQFNPSYFNNDITKRELAAIYRSDLSLIISEYEMKLLTKTFKINASLLHYLPFLETYSKEAILEKLPDFDDRIHFIFVGNFLHAPNYDAVLYLKNTIWPLIRQQLPKAELHIYGAYMPHKVKHWHKQKDGFLVKGFIEDLNTVMKQAKVCLAPLRFGAGLKGKLIKAMLCGTPCVMSAIAAEGMFGNFEPNGFVENKPKQFALKAVALYTNANLWQNSTKQGTFILAERFNSALFQKPFQEKISKLMRNLESYRANNFIGQILNYHTLQSAKYMSKWIEAKSKI